jgi:integrase/recombinase XerD
MRSAPLRVKPLLVFRKPKTCRATLPDGTAAPIPATAVGVLILEYRVAGKRVAQSTGIRVAYARWDAAGQRIKGQGKLARADNDLLEHLLSEAKDACLDLKRSGQPAAPGRARAIALGQTVADETLLQSWDAWHGRQQARAVAGEILAATAAVPALRRPLLLAWLKAECPAGFLTRELSAAKARDFARFLLTHYAGVSSPAYANKCARLLSEVAACAVERGALPYHPIGKLLLPKFKKKALTFLTADQLQALAVLPLPAVDLRRTRDAFLFICYTGFAHVDARAFDAAAHLRTDATGLRWVVRPRQKSGVAAHIALLPPAEALLAKYAGRIPVPVNQVMNRRLHEIEAALDLPFSLTCHVGRRTCGMLLLERGLSMEVVSRWLGHSSVKMTENLYANVQQTRIGRELRAAGLV